MKNLDSDIQPQPTPPSGPADTDERPHGALFLRVSDARFLIGLAMLVVGMLGLQMAKSAGWGLQPVQIERLGSDDIDYRIDINHSHWVEWAQLPDIGEATARRIVADREINGPFASVDDLCRVPGIGQRSLEKLRPWLTRGDASATAHDVARMDSNH